MNTTVFSTQELPADARASAWSSALGGFAISPTVDRDWSPEQSWISSFLTPGGLRFSVVESTPQRIAPTAGVRENVFWISMLLRGQSHMTVGRRERSVRPGDLLCGRRGAPGDLDIFTPFRMLIVNIPGEVLARTTLLPLPEHVLQIDGSSGMGHVLATLLGAIVDKAGDFDETGARALDMALPTLLGGALFGTGGAVPLGGAVSVKAALLNRLWQGIERRLGDSDLSPESIAAEQGISLRYLQKLFEENGTSFRDHVRRRRLEQCHQALSDPLKNNVSVTTICFNWGFENLATFSRAFKDAYGISPRDFRNLQQPRTSPLRRRRLSGLQCAAEGRDW